MNGMKQITTVTRKALLVLCVVAASACARHRIIPDNTLSDIFHDAFLTNAYIENRRFSLDSLDVYGPIFEHYGYTTEDVRYTIGNFSKRKSARLGDVVERTISRLEEEGLYYEREAAVLDTIDNIARRTFRRTAYADSLIRVSRLRDTDRLRLRLTDIRPGEYKIDYDYRVDSLDEAANRRSIFVFERADSSTYGRQQQSIYRNNRTEHVSRTMTADTSARVLKINLLEFSQPSSSKKMNHFGITITDLKVVYTPDAASAVDSLYERQLPIRIFYEAFFGDEFAGKEGAEGDVDEDSETDKDADTDTDTDAETKTETNTETASAPAGQ